MRHALLSLILMSVAQVAAAFEIENRAWFGQEDSSRVLRIISNADIAFFEPAIESFLTTRGDLAIDYVVASSTEVMRAIYEEGQSFDLVISSAMDLQTKLANDGKAQTHRVRTSQPLPAWAVWNDMLFAFTQEPAAIVVSNAAFADLPKPSNRQELINLLRQYPDRFRGRVGTYDVRRSGLGYLFATQDTRASETYWRLTEVMGGLETRLYCCSSDMIDAVTSGELLIAYNVLASYAANLREQGNFTIILPADFTTVMLRTAMIPQNAKASDMSGEFIDHLMERTHGDGAQLLTHPDLNLQELETALHRIRLGPGLLVFLDQLKRMAFLAEWESAILRR